MTTKQLKNFPGAGQITSNDLIYMSQNGVEVAASPAQVATALAITRNVETFTAGPLFTGSISSTTLTASAVTGTIVAGQTLFGAGVTANSVVQPYGTNGTTGTGGAGTYALSQSSTVGSGESMGAASATQFAPGFSPSITLTGTYGSINNIDLYFDAAPQLDCTLSGQILSFNPTVPVGISTVIAKGGATRSIAAPAAGSVTAPTIAAGAVTANALAAGAVTAPAIASGAIDGTKLNVSGAGTLQPTISFAHNPSGLTSWTVEETQNLEGVGVDIGNYGTRSFGGNSIPTSVSGAINIPATSTLYGQGVGIAGYAKTASTTTGAVPIFGQGDCEATGALVWGVNTVSQDNGFQTTVWGAEIDVNLSNVNSAAFGVNVVGGSTVEPTSGTYGFWVGPLGTFSTPPKRWSKGVFVGDASSITGVEIGTANVAGGSAGGSMPLTMFFNPNSSGRQLGAGMTVDSGGNLSFCQTWAGALLSLTVGGTPGVGRSVFTGELAGSIPACAFLGATPKGQVTGWGTPTGAGVISNFPGATATTSQCGQAIAQLISDLKGFGLYGA